MDCPSVCFLFFLLSSAWQSTFLWVIVVCDRLFVVFRMSVASPKRLQRLDKAVVGLDRPALLRSLGMQKFSAIVGDFTDLHCVSSSASRVLKIHKSNVPFLDDGTALECCSGAKLQKWGHTVVAVPYLDL